MKYYAKDLKPGMFGIFKNHNELIGADFIVSVVDTGQRAEYGDDDIYVIVVLEFVFEIACFKLSTYTWPDDSAFWFDSVIIL